MRWCFQEYVVVEEEEIRCFNAYRSSRSPPKSFICVHVWNIPMYVCLLLCKRVCIPIANGLLFFKIVIPAHIVVG